MLLISCLCQKWRKRIATLLIISRKKNYKHWKKRISLVCCYGKKVIRRNFANQGDPNSIIAAKFYKLLGSWTNWEYYSSWSNILILVHRYIFVIWKKIYNNTATKMMSRLLIFSSKKGNSHNFERTLEYQEYNKTNSNKYLYFEFQTLHLYKTQIQDLLTLYSSN